MSTLLSAPTGTSCAVVASAATSQDVVRRARRRPRRRTGRLLVALILLLLCVVAVRLTLGDFTITLPDVVRIVAGADIPGTDYVLMESKLPRAVLGVLVGGALGLGGAIFQATLRNPLASPDIIGVSIGASTAAVFAIVTLGLDGGAVAPAAVLGALLVGGTVRLIAGRGDSHRLVLAGVGMAAGLYAAVQYLFTRADVYDAQLVLRWLTGSLNQVGWPAIRLLAVLLLIAVPVVAWLARTTPIAELGADTAAGLGVGPRRTDALLLAGVLLVALAVAAAGPVAFVSFLAGPIARALNRGRTTLAGAALAGALIVVAADHVAAYLVPGVNLPVGVVTGAFGAPFLVWLLATGRASGRAS